MMHVMEDALSLYEDRDAWSKMMKRVMEVDFSWNSSAEKYISLYKSMLEEQ